MADAVQLGQRAAANGKAAPLSAAAAGVINHVRVESESSVGRSYSETAKGANVERGLGARRRALRTRTFDPFKDGAAPVVDSLSQAYVNLRCATRAQVLAYFENTWELTTTLFSVSRWPAGAYVRRVVVSRVTPGARLRLRRVSACGCGRGAGRVQFRNEPTLPRRRSATTASST